MIVIKPTLYVFAGPNGSGKSTFTAGLTKMFNITCPYVNANDIARVTGCSVKEAADKGLKILLNTYWCSRGWKNGQISEEDFVIAREEGYMFDYPVVITHDEHLKKLREVLEQINPEEVANVHKSV